MRLIDADRFEAYCYDTVKGDYHDGVRRVLEDIDKAETIEAIPVRWVKLWLENNSKTVRNPDYYDWDFTKEPIDYYVTIYPHEVERMLNDWEKENESNI